MKDRVALASYLNEVYTDYNKTGSLSLKGCKEIVDLVADPHATVLKIENRVPADFANALKHFKRILIRRNNLSIILNNIALTDEIFEYLAKIVAHNHSIKIVQVSRNLLTDKCAGSVSAMLSKNRSVSLLDLTGNAFTDKGMILISEGLRVSPSKLSRLVFAKNQISDKGIIAFADAIKANPLAFSEIRKLEFNQNLIGDDGCVALATLCMELQSIDSIQLSRNLVTDKGAESLAAALSSNCGLKEIELSLNQVSSKGATALAEALSSCQPFGGTASAETKESNEEEFKIELDLSQNKMIGRHGYSAFFQSDRPMHLELFRLVVSNKS